MKKSFIKDPYLKLWLPLYELDGNSFMSKDIYGHLCTKTGVTWGMQGGTFDAVDGTIACGTNAALALTGDMSFLFWIKPSGTDAGKDVISKAAFQVDGYEVFTSYDAVTGKHRLIYRSSQASAAQTSGSAYADSMLPDVFSHGAVIVNGADALFYVNGVLTGYSEQVSHIAPTANVSRALTLGKAPVNNDDLNGILGEVLIYDRVLTFIEIQNLWLATKWRYR